MSELYRFKFRSDFFEIELESTDSGFINKQIMQLIEMSTRPLEDRPKLLAAYSSSDTAPDAETEEATAEEAMAEEEPATEEAEPAPPEEKPKPKPRRKSSGQRGTARKKATATSKRKTSSRKKTTAPAKATAKKAPKAPAAKTSGVNPTQIADYVKSSENFELFQHKILKKANQLNRILLSFYFAEKAYGKKGLTTGDIESITEALGSGIKSTNVSSQLKKHDQLFNSRGERKRGSVVHYKLNKKGKEKFEELIKE